MKLDPKILPIRADYELLWFYRVAKYRMSGVIQELHLLYAPARLVRKLLEYYPEGETARAVWLGTCQLAILPHNIQNGFLIK